MKRALITIATVGILAPTAWVGEANAQYMGGAPAPAYSAAPAYGPSQRYAPSRRYARRAYRRSARQTCSRPHETRQYVRDPHRLHAWLRISGTVQKVSV